MAEYWKCPKCGRVNVGYVGTCGCGGLKADGTQASEEEYKQEQGFKDIETKAIKKKWQCPNCLKINEGDFCSCGHVKGRDDKYVEESDNPSQVTYTTPRSGSNVIISIINAIISIIIGIIIIVGFWTGINDIITSKGTTHKYKHTSSNEVYSSINRTLKITSHGAKKDKEITDILKLKVSSYGEALGLSDGEYEKTGHLFYEETVNGNEYYRSDGNLFNNSYYYIYNPDTDTWQENDIVYKR